MVQDIKGHLYTGITVDLHRRVVEHNSDLRRGSKWCYARRPVVLVWSEAAVDRSAASKREYQIKKLRRDEKLQMIEKMGQKVLKA